MPPERCRRTVRFSECYALAEQKLTELERMAQKADQNWNNWPKTGQNWPKRCGSKVEMSPFGKVEMSPLFQRDRAHSLLRPLCCLRRNP